MPTRQKLLAATGVTALALAGALASAGPAWADEPYGVDLRLPELTDNPYDTGDWLPSFTNDSGADLADVRVTVTLNSTTDGPLPVRLIGGYVDNRNRCTLSETDDGAATAECAFDLPTGETPIEFVLSVTGPDPLAHPDVAVSVTLTGPDGTALAEATGGFTVTHSPFLDRLGIDVPATVPSDATPDTDGVPWTYTLTNNTDTTLTGASLHVYIEGMDGEDSRIRAGGDCQDEPSDWFSCPLEPLAPGQERTGTLTLWVAEEELDYGDMSVTVHDADDEIWAIDRADVKVGRPAGDGAGEAHSSLPKTGTGLGLPLAGGAAAVALGAGLLLVSRCRRRV